MNNNKQNDLKKEFNSYKSTLEDNYFHKLFKNIDSSNSNFSKIPPNFILRFSAVGYVPKSLQTKIEEYTKKFDKIIHTNHSEDRAYERSTPVLKSLSLYDMGAHRINNKKSFHENQKGKLNEEFFGEIRYFDAAFDPVKEDWHILSVGMRFNNAMTHTKIKCRKDNNNELQYSKIEDTTDFMFIVSGKNLSEESQKKKKPKIAIILTSWAFNNDGNGHDYSSEDRYKFASKKDVIKMESITRRKYKDSLTTVELPNVNYKRPENKIRLTSKERKNERNKRYKQGGNKKKTKLKENNERKYKKNNSFGI